MKSITELSKLFIVTLVAVLFSACGNSTDKNAEKIFKQKDALVADFKGVSIIRSRGKNVISFSIRRNQKANQLFFDKVNGDFFLTNYILEDSSVLQNSDSSSFKSKMQVELKRLLTIMDNFAIADVSSEFENLGIDTKYYLKNQKVILYVSKPDLVKNERWKEYLNNSEKKFDDNWYYTKDE